MKIARNEIRTGLLVVLTLATLVAALIYLGAPGFFVPQKIFRIHFNNASGIKEGAQVMLAGRKIGQVLGLYSPVPEKDRPRPELEALVEVQVQASAKIYRKVTVEMVQPRLLGEAVIDFTYGEEASGLAPDRASFIGSRPPGIADAVPAVLEKIDPVLTKAAAMFESLQATANNLTYHLKSASGDVAASVERAGLDTAQHIEQSRNLVTQGLQTVAGEYLDRVAQARSELVGYLDTSSESIAGAINQATDEVAGRLNAAPCAARPR